MEGSLQKYVDSYKLKFPEHITIETIPDANRENCQITINVPWEIALAFKQAAAPLFSAISQSVDARTVWEKNRDRNREINKLQYRDKLDNFHAALRHSARQTHRKGLSYANYARELESVLGEGFIPPLPWKQSDVRNVWRRSRIWSVQRRFKRGQTLNQIAQHFNLTNQSIKNLIGEDRRCLKLPKTIY